MARFALAAAAFGITLLALSATAALAVAAAGNGAKKPTARTAAASDGDLDRFNAWLRELDPNAVVHIRRDNTVGNGVFANRSIAKGDVVLSLPITHVFGDETLTLPPAKFGGVDYFTVLKKHLAGRADDRIALAVMTERAIGGLSRWAPWIRVLPEIGVGLNLPQMWPAAERSRIVPTSVRDAVNAQAANIAPRFESLKVPLAVLQQHAKATLERAGKMKPATDKKAAARLEEAFSLERYKWAHSIVASRAWNVHGRKYLVPGADMFNHDYDVEDKAFDFKRDTLVRPSRSQKFTLFHTINASAAAGPRSRVEAISDRRCDAGAELFESYGDSTDSVYFQFLGFVASDVEDLVLAAMAPDDGASPPHMDLELFAAAWSASTVRNRRDCLDLELVAPAPLVKQANQTEEPPFLNPVAAHVDFAKRTLGVGGNDGRDEARVCVRYGELHPLHYLFHYITQLPGDFVRKNSCLSDGVDPMSRHATTTRLYPAARVMLAQIRKCLTQTYGGPAAHTNASLRAMSALTNDLAKRVLTASFGVRDQKEVEQFEMNVVDDALEARIVRCRLLNIFDRAKCFEGFDNVLQSELAPAANFAAAKGRTLAAPAGAGRAADVAALMRLRMSLQQRMIVLEIQRKVESRRAKALDQRREERGDDAADSQQQPGDDSANHVNAGDL